MENNEINALRNPGKSDVENQKQKYINVDYKGCYVKTLRDIGTIFVIISILSLISSFISFADELVELGFILLGSSFLAFSLNALFKGLSVIVETNLLKRSLLKEKYIFSTYK